MDRLKISFVIMRDIFALLCKTQEVLRKKSGKYS